jgi:hypothetical protein
MADFVEQEIQQGNQRRSWHLGRVIINNINAATSYQLHRTQR